MTKLEKTFYTIFITAITVTGLIYAKNFLIPLIFALIVWVLIRKLKAILDKINFLKEYVPSWIKSILLSFFLILIVGILGKVISSNISSIVDNYPKYEKNFIILLQQLNQLLNIDIASIFGGSTNEFSGSITGLLNMVLTPLTNALSNIFMVVLYILFVFLEEANFSDKLQLAIKNKKSYQSISKLLEEMEQSISSYLGVKTLVSLITGILSAITLTIIGVDAPIFWALIIFILNYIPTIGSLIGTLFPAVFCLFQFCDFGSFATTLIFVGLIQVIIGNVLEPKLVGSSMNVSALVAILALSLWGIIWGTTGMILSVPITVIMVIVLSKFNATKPIAIMLSDKGKI